MRFSLLSLILATTYFGLAAVGIGAWNIAHNAAILARSEGRFVCGNYQAGLTMAVPLLAIAGMLTLFGRSRIAIIPALLGAVLLIAH